MSTASPQRATEASVSIPPQSADNSQHVYREIPYEHSRSLAPLLNQLGISLLISTYQAGKVALVGVNNGSLALSFHNFERAMGIAVKPDMLAVGTNTQIWYLRSAPDIAPRIEPVGRHDGCFLARIAHFTGDIHTHDMAWAGSELWVVNTLFSCLCTLHDQYSFVPRWRPPFITGLAAEDRCHLNGLAMHEGQPEYVTALAETDTPRGWRPTKATSGCLISVRTGEAVVRGLAMPHSPRVHGGRIWLLDSGTGRLVTADPATARVNTVVELPGYTRGLALYESFAFVGLSKIRETSTFGGVPIAEKRDQLKCGVAVVDLAAGRAVAHLEFKAGVDEIFDVQVLPGMRFPAASGPFPVLDGKTIWLVPDPSRPDAQRSR